MGSVTHDARTRLTVLIALTAMLLAVAATLLSGQARAATPPGCGEADAAPEQVSLEEMREATLCLLNGIRRHYGLAEFTDNKELSDSATGHSNDMVRHHYFSHYGSEGSTLGGRVQRSGYLSQVSFYAVGENIGGGVGRIGSPWGVVHAWMHSPEHRANILDSAYHDSGIGISRGYPDGGGRDAATYTLDLGGRG